MSITYDMALTEWINAGLNRNSLDKTVEIIENNKPFDKSIIRSHKTNKLYIEKILREEVIKQFSGNKRPMLEVVLNAIDARPQNQYNQYKIDIKLKKKQFMTADNGKGMSLDEILRLLIIPFSTEKKPIDDIGRFGVGFLSTFNYCISAPKKSKIVLETKKGNDAYTITFYSKGYDVSDIRMKVHKTRKRHNGTSVYIKTRVNREDVSTYMNSSLHSIPDYIAKISINKKPINTGTSKWYSAPAKMHVLGKDITQPVGILIEERIEPSSASSKIKLTAQGVLVKEYDVGLMMGDVTVSFPPAIQLVEGRDQFKINDNYHNCVHASMVALENHIDDHKKTPEYIARMADIIPQIISSLKIPDLKNIPNINSIRNKLFPGKSYVINVNDVDKLTLFYGADLAAKSFATTVAACEYWKEYYGNSIQLRQELDKNVKIMNGQDFYRMVNTERLSQYPNLRMLARCEDALKKYNFVNLVDLDVPGPSAFFHESGSYNAILTINCRHPNLVAPYSFDKMYMTISDYLGTPNERDVLEKIRGIDSSEAFLQKSLERMPFDRTIPLPEDELKRK